MPADTLHAVRMDGVVQMRALFLRADAAARGPAAVTVIAVSPLLRELILTVCGEPVVWDARGPIRLVAALVLHEIGRARTRKLSLPACRDPRLARVAAALVADPADPRDLDGYAAVAGASVRTLARLFRSDTGMSFQQWRCQLRMTEALARIAQGMPPGEGGGGRRLCQRAGVWRRVSKDVRHHAGDGRAEAMMMVRSLPDGLDLAACDFVSRMRTLSRQIHGWHPRSPALVGDDRLFATGDAAQVR